MAKNSSSALALIPFVSVENMMQLILDIGVQEAMAQIAEYIEEDFRRWPLFDKTPRVASHSRDGVIDLMPTSDGIDYGFKYVNGHPKNTRDGLQTVTAFGLLASILSPQRRQIWRNQLSPSCARRIHSPSDRLSAKPKP